MSETFRQGDVVYFNDSQKDRPAVILSNNHICRVANELLIAPLSSSTKVLTNYSPYHVDFKLKGRESVIKVDNIKFVPTDELTLSDDWLNPAILSRTLTAYSRLVSDLPL